MNNTHKSKDWCSGFCRTCGTGCAQYCEEIFQLKAENADLLEEKEQWEPQWRDQAAAGEIRALMAENARLREALEECVKPPYKDSDLKSLILTINAIARAALGGK